MYVIVMKYYLCSLSLLVLQYCRGIAAFTDLPLRSSSIRISSSIGYGYDDFHGPDENLSSMRKERLAREKANQIRFATGKDLVKLRNDLAHLRDSLLWAQAVKDDARVQELTKAIDDGERCDADLVYSKALAAIESLKKSQDKEDRKTQISKWERVAKDARSCLSRFQLEGSGDTLVATKVTSDEDFPRGTVIFDASLSSGNNMTGQMLSPIQLPSDTAKKWGIDKLCRYKGKGFVTKKKQGSSKARPIEHEEGQLIMYENHFSFVWVPTRRHVFFGRPSQEVTIRMLRDIVSKEDEMENTREHLEECIDIDMTTSIARTLSNTKEPLRRIRRLDELQKLDKEHLDKDSLGFSDLFNGDVLKSYLDTSLDSESPGFMSLFNKNWKGFLSGVLDNDEKKEA
mmetsp:Transcript_22812/g.33688  ORF Transcript_22812/g.33688 Transcript_22812/m.33688 type:complete len:400 (+) Transcript_22812:532-1731(+)